MAVGTSKPQTGPVTGFGPAVKLLLFFRTINGRIPEHLAQQVFPMLYLPPRMTTTLSWNFTFTCSLDR